MTKRTFKITKKNGTTMLADWRDVVTKYENRRGFVAENGVEYVLFMNGSVYLATVFGGKARRLPGWTWMEIKGEDR